MKKELTPDRCRDIQMGILREIDRFCKENGCNEVDFIISQEADKRIYLSYVDINGSTICKIYKQMLLADFLCAILEG